MRKIFIVTEGGSEIGFGHVTRCLSLYQAFEAKGITPKFIVNGDKVIEDILRGRDAEIFDWLRDKDRLFGMILGADIAVVDSYLADLPVYKRVAECSKVAAFIDDNKRLDYPSGVVVNGTLYAEELFLKKREDVRCLLGTDYLPLRKDFWRVPKKTVRRTPKSILITFGGHDSRNLTPKILDALASAYTGMIKNVFVGEYFLRSLNETSIFNMALCLKYCFEKKCKYGSF